MMKTTSRGFAASLDFLSPLAVLVSSRLEEFVDETSEFVLPVVVLVPVLDPLASPFLSLSLGKRVVTLAMGTARTFVRERVSISAVTDIPGRNCSFSLIRIFTENLVASVLF